jgi:hypothetical protein
MKRFHAFIGPFAFGVAALLAASSLSEPAFAKACEQLVGGACRGHWECKTDDGDAGFCNDDGAKDCYCRKGAKSRTHFGFSFGMGAGSSHEEGNEPHGHQQTQPTQPGNPPH